MGNSSGLLRSIPSTDRVLAELGEIDLPRPLVVATIRREIQQIRESLKHQPPANGADFAGSVLDRVKLALDRLRRQRLQPVINGTGIIIHTNLGRSPMGAEVVAAIAAAASNYNNLEYDVEAGERGGRAEFLEHSLALLCGGAAATIVNNCAAALMLMLRHFAAAPPRTQVIISRGELVQIGGGFRIPEILAASGAVLREVGTTNITTVADYEAAIDEQTALILKVHQSNFAMSGFVESSTTDKLASLAAKAGVPLIEDLGSGAMFDTRELGGEEREPTPADALSHGADLVCFSGDKLFGGPQAGIIAGRADLVGRLKRDPFFRALRCDKLVLAGLQASVDLLLSGRAERIPIRAMMRIPLDVLRNRARDIVEQLVEQGVTAAVSEARSQVGGGSLPRTVLPSVAVELAPPTGRSADDLAAALRRSVPPLIACIADDRVKIDLRTVFPAQDADVVGAVLAAARAG